MSDEYLLNIDKIYYFLIKKVFVYLRMCIFCCTFAPAFSFREASEILAQTRCCDLQYRLFRI